ncbi:MAG TPA: RpiR family transcriptional regulator [Lachnoclostridium phytofermentans]|uniref:RpiR family transcriptional regulator n=1 Tax=Lachnoclostridium phytofermentans TaxID=66219 RepID=A0A3D2X756_9FIRM|nr:MurR/RpiR family transcriptional regulator [Lachnoclostridium sp.]HCL02547.1 RpiR family transcriptional regulator [Lachnoclostridium phytofermentans]
MIIGDTNILIKIREIKDSLTPVEQKVADCILEYQREVPKMSIKTLSSISGTSEASVLRFCKTLGFTGYRDFIISVTSSLVMNVEENSEEDSYTDLQPGDDFPVIIRKIAKNNIQSIEDTISVLNINEVIAAVKSIQKARRIYFFGIGASSLVCTDAVHKFLRINKECFTWEDSHQQYAMATLLTSDDVAILVSNSGKTQEIVDIMEIAKKQKAKVIAITRYSKSILAERADIVLSISTPEIMIRSGAMGSRIAMLTIVDILFSCVASADYDVIKKYLKKTNDIIKEKRR